MAESLTHSLTHLLTHTWPCRKHNWVQNMFVFKWLDLVFMYLLQNLSSTGSRIVLAIGVVLAISIVLAIKNKKRPCKVINISFHCLRDHSYTSGDQNGNTIWTLNKPFSLLFCNKWLLKNDIILLWYRKVSNYSRIYSLDIFFLSLSFIPNASSVAVSVSIR